jgi:hypothetical protein
LLPAPRFVILARVSPAIDDEFIDISGVISILSQAVKDYLQVIDMFVTLVVVELLHLDTEDQPVVIYKGNSTVVRDLDPADQHYDSLRLLFVGV